MILAGDVGATKTLLGLFRPVKGELRCVREESFPSNAFDSFELLVDEFLSRSRAKIHRCAVGVAGPVVDGKSHVINLRWPVDARRMARVLGTADVRVINDLEATAWGVPELPPHRLASLTPGLRARRGNAALIAAGTGLGMALMPWDGTRWHPQPSEGGHQAFAPRDDLEIGLLRYLRRRHGRVSLERVLSGPALSVLYDFLVRSGRGGRSRLMKRRLAAAEDPNADVARAGLTREDAVAGRALDLFVSLFGAVAGDLALVAKATGGLYVGGGIAPQILPRLRAGGFVRAFRDKGRLTPLVEIVPVRVILEPRTALMGAARCATTNAPSRKTGENRPKNREKRR